MGLVVSAPGLSSTGSVVLAHGFSCSAARGIPPGSGVEPTAPECPAMAGGFFTTELPQKPRLDGITGSKSETLIFGDSRDAFKESSNKYYPHQSTKLTGDELSE